MESPNSSDSLYQILSNRPGEDSLRKQSTEIILLIGVLLSAGLGLLGFLNLAGVIKVSFMVTQNVTYAVITSSLCFGTICFFIYFVYKKSGGDWPGKVLTFFLVFVILLPLPGELFSKTIPQVVWGPIIIAFTLTSLRWSLFISFITVVCIALLYSEFGAFYNIASSLVFLAMLSALVTFRLLYDRHFIKERKQREQIQFLAFHDPLTGLPNRRLLTDRLKEGLKKCERSETSLAVIFIDLDHFTRINDSLGHGLGDELLENLATLLRSCVRKTDTVARFGGDEFVIVLEHLNDLRIVDRVLNTINQKLEDSFSIGGHSVKVTASMGIAVFPQDGNHCEELLKHADQALYLAKEGGRNQFFYSTEEQQRLSRYRFQLSQDLNFALSRGELYVVYQPIFDLNTGCVVKAEALARWSHPKEGEVSPGVFIPIAEGCGLIHSIGNWVFQSAASQAKEWQQHIEDFQISINRSPVQFRDDDRNLVEFVDSLSSTDLPASCLNLEITEGVLLEANENIAHHLKLLRELGIQLSLDDFGTGYSSISYLHNFDLDYVKIDRSFVEDLTYESKQFQLCKSIVAMAHSLDLKVIAEGVETEQQMSILTELKCDYAQGYYLGRPMIAEEMEKLIIERKSIALHS